MSEYPQPSEAIKNLIIDTGSINKERRVEAQNKLAKALEPSLRVFYSKDKYYTDNPKGKHIETFIDWKVNYSREARWDIVTKKLQLLEKQIKEKIEELDSEISEIILYPDESGWDEGRCRIVARIIY